MTKDNAPLITQTYKNTIIKDKEAGRECINLTLKYLVHKEAIPKYDNIEISINIFILIIQNFIL